MIIGGLYEVLNGYLSTREILMFNSWRERGIVFRVVFFYAWVMKMGLTCVKFSFVNFISKIYL